MVLKGLGYGVVHQDSLHLMVFTAPRLHYFAELRPRVEALAASAALPGTR